MILQDLQKCDCASLEQLHISSAPKISVLMPVYNGARYLRQAVESILAQNFREFEFVIIDDGSTDSSLEILRSYRDSRIRIARNEINLGLIQTLNKGLDLVRSDLVVRMDADDISVPHRLSHQFEFMSHHPEIGICGGRVMTFGDSLPAVWRPPTDPSQIKAKLFFENCLAHNTVAIRKSFLSRFSLSYEAGFPHAEDWRLWWQASNYFSIANLTEILVLYRSHAESVSASSSLAQYETGKKIIHDIRLYHHLPIDESATPIFYSRFYKPLLSSISTLLAAEKGLKGLSDWNIRTNSFDHKYFIQNVRETWLQHSLSFCIFGIRTFFIFWHSPLSRGHRYSIESLRLFLSCIFRRRLTQHSLLLPMLPIHLPILIKSLFLKREVNRAIQCYWSDPKSAGDKQ